MTSVNIVNVKNIEHLNMFCQVHTTNEDKIKDKGNDMNEFSSLTSGMPSSGTFVGRSQK